MGYILVRGSSDKKSNFKYNITFKNILKKAIQQEHHQTDQRVQKKSLKKGLLYLSQKTSIPLVPVGISYSKKWILKKTWDKFEIPKPFSKVKIFLGEPILINEEEDLDKYIEIVKNGINSLNNQIEF